MRKSTKIAVVLAAAALLVAGFAFTTLAAGHWVKEAEGLYYYEEDGQKVYDEWRKDFLADGTVKWYYLGSDGYMVRNQLVDYDENTYWVGGDGAKATDTWVPVPVDANDSEDNFGESYRWYFFNAKGQALKEQKKAIKGEDYLFDAQGRMSFGYVEAKPFAMCEKQDDPFSANCVYYCGTNEDGAVKKLYWAKIEGVEDKGAYEEDKDAFWVYFKKDGIKATADDEFGVLSNGKRYYFDAEGRMKTGWQEIGTPSTYSAWLGEEDEGWAYKKAWVYTKKGTSDNKEKWFYVNNRGEKQGASKVLTINKKQYAFDENAEMLAGIVALDNVSELGVITQDTTVSEGIDASKETLEVWKNRTENLYYFSDSYKEDGSLKKSGSFLIDFLDDSYKLYTGKTGEFLDGLVSKKWYKNGYLLCAESDFGKQVINVAKKSETENWKLLDTFGNVTAAGKKTKDNDGNWYVVKAEKVDGKDVEKIYLIPEYYEKASTIAENVLKGNKTITIDKKEYTIDTSAAPVNGVVKVVLK